MKQIAIQKIFSYFFIDSAEIESSAFDERLEKLNSEIKELFERYDIHLAPGYTTFYGLDKYSISNCQSCSKLMLNRDKNPAGFGNNELTADLNWVILDGGIYQGKLLCEECLPFSHRWGHAS